jgi:hypothetical protein
MTDSYAQLSGTLATERANLLAPHMKAMGLLDSARILSVLPVLPRPAPPNIYLILACWPVIGPLTCLYRHFPDLVLLHFLLDEPRTGSLRPRARGFRIGRLGEIHSCSFRKAPTLHQLPPQSWFLRSPSWQATGYRR